MPVDPTHPGIYVQEVPSGVRTIPGVSTSTALFIGGCASGPLNMPIICRTYSDFTRKFSEDATSSNLARYVKLCFMNGGTTCYVMRIASGALAATLQLRTGTGANSLLLTAKSVGLAGNDLRAAVSYDTDQPEATFNVELFRWVLDSLGNRVKADTELWRNVSMDQTSATYAPAFLSQNSLLVNASLAATPIASASVSQAPFQAAGTAGTDGSPPLASDYGDAYVVADREIDLFNILVLPSASGLNQQQLWGPASIFCKRRRAILLMDPPDTWTSAHEATTGVDALRIGLVKDHAALYFPRVTITENGLAVQLGPTGAIAGVMARIDTARGVWKAPAGTEADIRGVVGLERRLSDLENRDINARAINTLRALPSSVVCWGARTMDGNDSNASDYKYVPVRRLALFMEESLYRGLKWVVFEPNDEALWAQIRLNVGAFMHGLFTQGAFQGARTSDAYFVRCDAETTAQDDRNQGFVNIWVGFAPLKPAEFVVLHLRQVTGTINV